MTKSGLLAVAAAALVVVHAGPLYAQSTFVSTSPASFSYPSADPDTQAVVTGPQLTISYKSPGKPSDGWHLSMRGTDLTSGADTIPAGNVTWVASPVTPFVASGVLSTTDQTIATATDAHAAGTQFGYITFSLKNLWTYKAGTYTQTITFTISSP